MPWLITSNDAIGLEDAGPVCEAATEATPPCSGLTPGVPTRSIRPVGGSPGVSLKGSNEGTQRTRLQRSVEGETTL